MICAIHNKEMKKNAKGWYCSTPITFSADKSKVLEWCQYKPDGQAEATPAVPVSEYKGEPSFASLPQTREPIKTVDYDERSRKIERQHSQEMAIRAMELMFKVNPDVVTGQIAKDGLMKTVKTYTDAFMEDLKDE